MRFERLHAACSTAHKTFAWQYIIESTMEEVDYDSDVAVALPALPRPESNPEPIRSLEYMNTFLYNYGLYKQRKNRACELDLANVLRRRFKEFEGDLLRQALGEARKNYKWQSIILPSNGTPTTAWAEIGEILKSSEMLELVQIEREDILDPSFFSHCIHNFLENANQRQKKLVCQLSMTYKPRIDLEVDYDPTLKDLQVTTTGNVVAIMPAIARLVEEQNVKKVSLNTSNLVQVMKELSTLIYLQSNSFGFLKLKYNGNQQGDDIYGVERLDHAMDNLLSAIQTSQTVKELEIEFKGLTWPTLLEWLPRQLSQLTSLQRLSMKLVNHWLPADYDWHVEMTEAMKSNLELQHMDLSVELAQGGAPETWKFVHGEVYATRNRFRSLVRSEDTNGSNERDNVVRQLAPWALHLVNKRPSCIYMGLLEVASIIFPT